MSMADEVLRRGDLMPRRKPILCMDFDGVLHSYTSGWKGAANIPDPPVPGAIAFLYEAIMHFDVCVYSSRSHQEGGIDAMRAWILRWEGMWMEEERILGRPQVRRSLLMDLHFPTEKPSAFVTIDDRALTFDGTWPAIETLLSFKPWNKR